MARKKRPKKANHSRGTYHGRLPWVALALSLGVHTIIVVSIARQPFHVNQHPPESRSLVWPLYNDTVHRVGPAADFLAIYHAGQMLQRGRSPYATETRVAPTPYYYPFRYLPAVGYGLGRLAVALPPRVAYLLWILFVELILASLIVLTIARAKPPWIRIFLPCVLLLSSPYFLELHMGQFTFVTLALLAMSIVLVERPGARGGRKRVAIAAATSYTAASLLKVIPLLAIPALVRRSRYWPLVLTGIAGVVITSVPYFAAHGGTWAQFWSANVTDPSRGMDSGNFGLAFFMRLLGGAGLSERDWGRLLFWWRIVTLGLSTVFALLSRSKHTAVGVCALVLAHFLSYPHVWEHHMSGVIVMGTLVLFTVVTDREIGRPVKTSLVVALVALALPTPFVFLDVAKDPTVFDPSIGWSLSKRCALNLSKTVPTVVLWVASVVVLIRPGLDRPWRREPSA